MQSLRFSETMHKIKNNDLWCGVRGDPFIFQICAEFNNMKIKIKKIKCYFHIYKYLYTITNKKIRFLCSFYYGALQNSNIYIWCTQKKYMRYI